jgi:hypothetical protein
MSTPTRLGDGIRLRRLLGEIRAALFAKRRLRRTNFEDLETGVRADVVERLVSAIREVDGLARAAGKRSKKGHGGLSPKARWYQLMAYLAQILDGVLRNVDLERFEGKMEELEKTVEELQRTGPQAAG